MSQQSTSSSSSSRPNYVVTLQVGNAVTVQIGNEGREAACARHQCSPIPTNEVCQYRTGQAGLFPDRLRERLWMGQILR
jgi:hypothetical protein